ncbi:MAG: sporulation-delaying protein SdpB family protein, partial [Actinomycetota bacterium]
MKRISRWVAGLAQRNPWTNVYGLSRSIFALGTAVTLSVSEASTLFAPIPTFLDPPRCSGLAGKVSVFCIVPTDRFDLARRVVVIVLLVIASGWRPRITGIPHWWISFSFVASTTVQDGG